jgi:glycosyltransferase involved in cell wall biosynthesis
MYMSDSLVEDDPRPPSHELELLPDDCLPASELRGPYGDQQPANGYRGINGSSARNTLQPRSRRIPWRTPRSVRPRGLETVLHPPLDLSVIVPVYNEAGNLDELHRRLVASLSELGRSYEIIYVDDGSSDQSYVDLQRIAESEGRARVVRLRRNFGQTAAIAAGVEYASGAFLIFIDADLQNDPADIPRLLALIEDGYDVVSGWRKDRHDAASRTLPSRLANSLISAVTGVHLHDYGCTLKVYRADLVKQLHLYGEMHRFIPAYLEQMGARVAELPVTHHPRTVGRSKYGMSRIFRVILDLFTVKFFGTYQTRPMHFFGTVGLVGFALSLVTASLMVWEKLALGVSMIQTPMLHLTALLGLMGFNAVFLGLLGELMMRTYFESQDKRPYQVKSVLNLPNVGVRGQLNVRH